MDDLVRLVVGLWRGDPIAIRVLIFAVIGTIVIVSATELARRLRGR